MSSNSFSFSSRLRERSLWIAHARSFGSSERDRRSSDGGPRRAANEGLVADLSAVAQKLFEAAVEEFERGGGEHGFVGGFGFVAHLDDGHAGATEKVLFVELRGASWVETAGAEGA